MSDSETSSPRNGESFTCASYSEFYRREDEFRKLCDELGKASVSSAAKGSSVMCGEREFLKKKFLDSVAAVHEMDVSSVTHDGSNSLEDRELLERQFTDSLPDLYDAEFPMRIYGGASGAPSFTLIYVACDGLREDQLPDIDGHHQEWLGSVVGSGTQGASAEEHVVIAAYAPPRKKGRQPEQAVFMCSAAVDPPGPQGGLRFSKHFRLRSPWLRAYRGDKSALYAGVAYAKQIAALGSAGFLKFHLVSSIHDIANAIKVVNQKTGGAYSAVAKEVIPRLVKLRDRVRQDIRSSTPRNALSCRFKMLSSKLDNISDIVSRCLGQKPGQKQAGRLAPGAFASASRKAHGAGPVATDEGSRYIAAA